MLHTQLIDPDNTQTLFVWIWLFEVINHFSLTGTRVKVSITKSTKN
jgi:hypothetical protein